MKPSVFSQVIKGFVGWLGWGSYCIWIVCYCLILLLVFCSIKIGIIQANVFVAIGSAVFRMVMYMGYRPTRPDAELPSDPLEGALYGLVRLLSFTLMFFYNLILILPFKMFIGHQIGMPLDVEVGELPGYIGQSFSALCPPHPFSFYFGLANILIIPLFVYQVVKP